VERGLDLAQRAAEMIDASDHLELIRRPDLGVVLYRRVGWDNDAYWRWSRRQLADQVAFALPTVHDGETVGRLVFLHPNTREAQVQALFDSMR
jgi:glutamate/tyrosine decarboxylase-like PLP-dependent enzyme